ncbi:MAG TPA: ABC transporter permease, partial [Verrucomicrobiae bacterium]|nr:ABC transporter permease [Verrucomicrobiae bacterium]
MTFLPVVERELRVTARNRRLYWGRCVAAFISLLLVIWFLLTFARGSNSAQNAMQIFWGLSAFAFLYCLVGGLFLTADCISEEKREGTLGLLFLTNLKGYDVAFGKLAATSLRAVYSVLAIYPILTIPLLLGGIEFAEIGRMALVLLVTLIFSLCIGLFVSSCSRE